MDLLLDLQVKHALSSLFHAHLKTGAWDYFGTKSTETITVSLMRTRSILLSMWVHFIFIDVGVTITSNCDSRCLTNLTDSIWFWYFSLRAKGCLRITTLVITGTVRTVAIITSNSSACLLYMFRLTTVIMIINTQLLKSLAQETPLLNLPIKQ